MRVTTIPLAFELSLLVDPDHTVNSLEAAVDNHLFPHILRLDLPPKPSRGCIILVVCIRMRIGMIVQVIGIGRGRENEKVIETAPPIDHVDNGHDEMGEHDVFARDFCSEIFSSHGEYGNTSLTLPSSPLKISSYAKKSSIALPLCKMLYCNEV